MKTSTTLKVKTILECSKKREIIENENPYITIYINQWLTNQIIKSYIMKDDNNTVVCFAILHKMDFDPLKQFKKPYLLDLIYTFEEHRRKGYASTLIDRMKENKEELTLFCSNKESS